MTPPDAVLIAAAPYLCDPKTRMARQAFLNTLLTGMTVAPLPLDAVVRGLEDMAVAGAEFRPVVVRAWCLRAQKLIEGEAGAKAAQDSRKAESSALGQPDANQSPSGWAEDELE